MLFTKDRPKLCLELTNLKLFGTSIMKFGGVLMCYYSFATLGFALGLGQFLVALGPKFKKLRCIITSARFLGCLDIEICFTIEQYTCPKFLKPGLLCNNTNIDKSSAFRLTLLY